MGRATNSTIPEAQGLTWRDTFFDNDAHNNDNADVIIAVFDFDYDKIEEFQVQVATSCLFCPLVFVASSCCCCYPCFYKQQIHWDTTSKHVCVTQDGIKFVQDKRQSGCGFSFQDLGKMSKTIPFDKVTDCDVTEPAGATCFCIDNVLPVVNIDTASGSRTDDGVPKHELSLIGLENPHKLKQLVWAMKRAQSNSGGGGGGGTVTLESSSLVPQAPNGHAMSGRGDNVDMTETNLLLRDIIEELKQMNGHLRKTTSPKK